ncbi:MAG TPA: glycosyltransferase family 39 protein [Nevskiales bacterium]|nr:glycosyltransferase family 39 protein [Nevskiales bacterium]
MPVSISNDLRWLLPLLLLLAFAFQGSRGIYDPDEGRYSNVALEMLRTGDWLMPQMAPSHPHFTKPPLTYWAIASGIRLFGYNEWAARAAHALAFVFTGLLVYGLGRRLLPGKPWLPALIYATSPMPFMAANTLTTDTLLTLWETLAMFGFITAWQSPGPADRRRWLLLMWLGYGLAFLTKGPPGLLPLLACVVFLWSARGAGSVRMLFSGSGLLLFALVGLSWYGAVIGSRPELLSYFIGHEIVARVTSDQFHNSEWYKGLTLYLPGLLGGGFPWVLAILPPAFRQLRSGDWRKARSAPRPAGWLLTCWVLLPLLIFMLSSSRLTLYILPLFVPLSLLSARELQDLRWTAWQRGALALWVVLLLALKAGSDRFPYEHNAAPFAAEIRQAIGTVRPVEIVFIDRTARYGLHLYLHAPLVTLRFREPGDIPQICRRLAAAAPRLWIVKDQARALFEQAAHDCGAGAAERRGQWQDMGIYLSGSG